MALDTLKELRQATGCGIVDCQKALKEADWNFEKAVQWLREKGKASAAKRSARTTKEGVVASYIHSNKKIGVLVSLLCETDFVARNEKFQQLAYDIAVHVAALDPMAVAPEEISAEVLEKERTIALEQAKASGKPAAIQEKIVEGKLRSFREERALLTQPFVKDPSKTVGDLIHEVAATMGEKVSVGTISRVSI